jgi:Zn-dependent protease
MLGEPPQTQYDLRFQILGIPVRVHPFFWLVVVLLGLGGGAETTPAELLIWVGCVFVSILIHELGHAAVALSHGWRPWITLYGFGGLASYQPTRHDARSQILISLAGPGAGFLFIALVMAIVQASGHPVQLLPNGVARPWISFVGFENGNLNQIIGFLWFINIFWGLLNLLPIYPLDGGQIMRELCLLANRAQGIAQSLWISIAMAGGVAVFSAFQGEIYLAFMFGYLAYTNYTLLQHFSGGGGYGGGRSW